MKQDKNWKGYFADDARYADVRQVFDFIRCSEDKVVLKSLWKMTLITGTWMKMRLVWLCNIRRRWSWLRRKTEEVIAEELKETPEISAGFVVNCEIKASGSVAQEGQLF